MKLGLSILFILLFTNGFSQTINSVIDSLTNKNQRVWISRDNANTAKVGDDCSPGLKLVFKIPNIVTFYMCESGKWKEDNYNFNIVSEGNKYFVMLSNGNIINKNYEIIVEKVRNINNQSESYFTRLKIMQYNTKTIFKLKSAN